jgi:pimeloyl-ACP methyl ester carboxylesterase
LRNGSGHALHCILHEPERSAERSDVVCLLLSPGVKTRVAPHRLYKKLADVFLARGIAVLRVDFYGLGDSEGEVDETQIDQFYRAVQLGRYVGDTRSAIDFCERELGARRLIVGGLCGGAITGLLTAEQDARVAAVYAIGMPPILDGVAQHAAVNMTRGQLRSLRAKYVQKILQPTAWLRLLSFRSDFRLVLASAFGGGKRRWRTADRHGADGVAAPTPPPAQNLNKAFVRALFRMLECRRPVLLLYGGTDRLYWEYQEKVAEPWANSLRDAPSQATVALVPNANHILGDPVWVARSRELTAEWLDTHFS